MKTLAFLVAHFSWALWFGGLVWIFLFVPAIFAHDRAVAGQAAPVIFRTFECVQPILAAIAVLAAAIWIMRQRCPALIAAIGLLLLAGVGAAVSPLLITRKMEVLRLAGQSGSPQFMKLHGYSMLVYVTQTALLLIAGLMLLLGGKPKQA